MPRARPIPQDLPPHDEHIERAAGFAVRVAVGDARGEVRALHEVAHVARRIDDGGRTRLKLPLPLVAVPGGEQRS